MCQMKQVETKERIIANEIICSGAEKGILFTFHELQILLYSCGVKEWKGIVLSQQMPVEQEVLYAIHHLSKTGILVEQDGICCIRNDVKTMLQMIGNPTRTEILNFQQEYFCYEKGQQVVVSEHYWKRKDTIKLRLFEQQEFQKWKEEMADDNR